MNDATPAPSLVSRHILVSGRVQGVAYRACAMREAERLGLRGWVRNLRSGEVEAVACGPGPAVAAFIAWAERGSPAASVAAVRVSEAAPPAETGFCRRPTV